MNEHRMELGTKPQKDTFYILSYDGAPTNEVNGEFTLPDYLPDTRRLLRCAATAQITGKFTDGEKGEFEGEVRASVVYMAEDGSAQVFETTLPFSQSISIPKINQSSVITVHCITESAQCRLSGPRKLHLRIRLRLPCRVLSEVNARPSIHTDGNTELPVCMQNQRISVTHIAMTEPIIRAYAEDIPSGENDASIRAILSMQITPHVTECRASGDEVLCTGEFLISSLCALTDADGNETCKPLRARIPFSEHLSFPEGAMTYSSLNPDITLRDIRYAPSDDGTACSLDFATEISALGMAECECETVCDAFLPMYDVKPEYTRQSIYRSIKAATGNFAVSGTLTFDNDESITQILDAYCKIKLDSHTQSGSKLTLSGNMEVNAIALCEGGRYLPISGAVAVTWDTDIGVKDTFDTLICHTEAYPLSIVCRVDEANRALICEAECAVQTSIGYVQPHTHITELNVSENQANVRSEEHPLLLYYPSENESIWDIAKAYRVTPEALRLINDLSPDTMVVSKDCRMLFIPSKAEAMHTEDTLV